ncbi:MULTISPECIES: ribosome silencing factor [Rhodoluna]|uniref:ribosome silencing factor n=1 Tax=Rhodoluna TaxID=529883 RepID=UPI0011075552|nr:MULTISPECIES: ribosome silencing factor [Rhodoluna]BDS49179.1 ribosomal silencing factor RsfS [Rhodoluna sp. KAS3]
MTATAQAIKTANLAANAAADKLAENIIALDITAVMPLTDIYVLASGRNERQVSAISDNIEEVMLENGFKLLHREGKELGRWILLDFGDVVCHVMHEEDRMFYSLERLYSDQPVVKLDIVPAAENLL